MAKKKKGNVVLDVFIGIASLVILIILSTMLQGPLRLINASFTMAHIPFTILMFMYIGGVVGLILISYTMTDTLLVLVAAILRFTSHKRLKRYKKYMTKGEHVYFKQARKLIKTF